MKLIKKEERRKKKVLTHVVRDLVTLTLVGRSAGFSRRSPIIINLLIR